MFKGVGGWINSAELDRAMNNIAAHKEELGIAKDEKGDRKNGGKKRSSKSGKR